MMTPVTVDILEASLHCKLKAYLKLMGQQGAQSDYGNLSIHNRQQSRQQAIACMCSRYEKNAISIGERLPHAILKDAPELLIGPVFEDDEYSVAFDGLKKGQWCLQSWQLLLCSGLVFGS